MCNALTRVDSVIRDREITADWEAERERTSSLSRANRVGRNSRRPLRGSNCSIAFRWRISPAGCATRDDHDGRRDDGTRRPGHAADVSILAASRLPGRGHFANGYEIFESPLKPTADIPRTIYYRKFLPREVASPRHPVPHGSARRRIVASQRSHVFIRRPFTSE